MGRFIELAAEDGHRFAAWEATPSKPARGALVIAPEIFGVNSHIRSVADGFAADGYHVLAAALFDRVQRDFESGYSADEIQAGRAIAMKVDFRDAMKDLAAAVAVGKAAGRVGLVGYCWGGTLAWVAAARVDGLACAISYYGGRIAEFVDEKPRCPVQAHFGEHDKTPTPEQARTLIAAHPQLDAHFYDAGHGFNCDQRASYDAKASQLARTRTLDFLAKNVG